MTITNIVAGFRTTGMFQKRYEEGYDLPGDDRYQQWFADVSPRV